MRIKNNKKTLVNPKPLLALKKVKTCRVKKLKNEEKGDSSSDKMKKVENKSSAKSQQKSKKSHKQELEGLKDIDPEFYEFLKKNDEKLLDFNIFDSDDSGDESIETDNIAEKLEKSDEEVQNNEKYHHPKAELEVASDESDFDDSEIDLGSDGKQKVTLNLLRQWQLQLENEDVSVDVVRKVIQAFSSALASISSDEASNAFKIVGSATFNGTVQLCLLYLQPAIFRILGISARSTTPIHKTKKWSKIKGCLRYYLTDLIRLIEQVSSPNILSALLKHLHQMAAMTASFTALGKSILKRLIVLWSTGDETVRVLAFLCILKITRNQQASMLHNVLKAMYLSYVRNSKFVSPNTLPSINFMRRSLVEMFALDLNTTYQHAFLYIRQLAIHLRNAVILKKKDSFQAVYNWQYINSLRLWADLLGATSNKPQLQPLLYPLVTITMGVIRLIPSAQYFPLRFHCIKLLISLAKETHTYIPILPMILEVLRSNTFNRKHTIVSMRPLQFVCILRLNKSQLSENGFRDEVIEQVFSLMLEYLAYESSSLAFSDLVVPALLALKSYLKECRNANYSRKLKQLLDKIQENSRFIEQERGKVTFNLHEAAKILAWETKTYNKGTPLVVFYDSWVKTHETKKRRQAAQIDSINADYEIPNIKRLSKISVPVRQENGEVELFPTDSESENQLQESIGSGGGAKKAKRNNKRKYSKLQDNSKLQHDSDTPLQEPELLESVDIVKDLDLDDW